MLMSGGQAIADPRTLHFLLNSSCGSRTFLSLDAVRPQDGPNPRI
jgi:hypothetical protein